MTASWRGVALITGWQTVASLGYYTAFAATGIIRAVFGLSELYVGLFITTTVVGYTLALAPSGALVDAYGDRRIMLAAIGVLMLGLVGVTIAPSYPALLLAGLVLGAGYAPAMPASNRGIVAAAPTGHANLAMGLKQVGVTTGSAIASILITTLAAVAAWQSGFLLIAAVSGGFAVAFAVRYQGVGGGGQMRRPDFGQLRGTTGYLPLVAAGVVVGATIFTTLSYTILYAEDVAGMGVAAAGGVLAATQLTGSVGRVLAGSLADRIGGVRGPVQVIGLQLFVAGVLFGILGFTPADPRVVALIFAGLGVSMLGSTGVYYSALTQLVPRSTIGTATAAGQIAINIGGLVTPPAFGLIVESLGYGTAWLVPATLSLLALGALAILHGQVTSPTAG
ncbi:MAG: MFS transporter [Haloquadratum sp.]|jgi:MFS family permease|nr:MFS transporter [Haloferacaceae archaeon]MDR9444657.1 MFS transporter [Haloquadratum sp.]